MMKIADVRNEDLLKEMEKLLFKITENKGSGRYAFDMGRKLIRPA
jgi:hypothetical protein